MAQNFTFNKAERLRSKKLIKELFDKGSSFFLPPLKMIYLPCTLEESGSSQVLFSVPKRNYKRAVDRNRLKRQMREAYRLNKTLIHDDPKPKTSYLIAFIYIGKEKVDFHQIESKLKFGLLRLKKV